MGNNKLPECEIVSLELAKDDKPKHGYAFKAFEKILEAHITGNALKMTFSSPSAVNKMALAIASHATEGGFDLFKRRDGNVAYFYLERQIRDMS